MCPGLQVLTTALPHAGTCLYKVIWCCCACESYSELNMVDLSQNPTVQLIGQLCGATQDEISTAADAGSVASVVSVCQQLARSSSQTDQLLGAQPDHQAQVWCQIRLHPIFNSVAQQQQSSTEVQLTTTQRRIARALALDPFLHPQTYDPISTDHSHVRKRYSVTNISLQCN